MGDMDFCELTDAECDAIVRAYWLNLNSVAVGLVSPDERGLVRAGAAWQAARAAPAQPVAWLVELRCDGVCKGWLRGGYPVDDRNLGWTTNANDALRFARQQDADAFRERFGFTATAKSSTHLSTEHIWLDASPAGRGEPK